MSATNDQIRLDNFLVPMNQSEMPPATPPDTDIWAQRFGVFKVLQFTPNSPTIRLSTVVSASEFKSEDPGFETLAGQGKEQFFCPSESTLVQSQHIFDLEKLSQIF